MEQRDTIIKNLREISHFFLSEHNPEETVSSVSEEKKPYRKLETSELKQHEPVHRDSVSPVIPLRKHSYPHITYVLANDDELKILFYIYSIAGELLKKNLSSAIVCHRTVLEKFRNVLNTLNAEFSTSEENDNADIIQVHMSDYVSPISIIGRDSSNWGAPLTPYMTRIDTVFITDFPLDNLHKLIQTDSRINTLFFTAPSAESSFKTYHTLKKLLQTNSSIWCGLIVNDLDTVSQGTKVYDAIASTLIHYSQPHPYLLGTLFNQPSISFSTLQECKRTLTTNHTSFADIAHQYSHHIFPAPIAK
ncbi:hypothetical protein KDK77_10850 [bacterium]|nr:hypothetical protein [bacterium]